MQFARDRLNGADNVIFAHRYITRSAEAGGENHVALSPEEFLERRGSGCFALNWESHGNHYGIGIEIDLWMNQGLRVVINGSRAYLADARKRYPDIKAVLIDVAPEILEQRLRTRGRETDAQIKKRLERHRKLKNQSDNQTIIN